MIAERWNAKHSAATEVLQLVSQISGLVAQVSVERLPEALDRILRAAWSAVRLRGGAVFLLDYTFDELHLLKEDGPTLRMVRQRGTTSNPGLESGHLLTLPVVAGTRQLGVLVIFSRNARVALSTEQESFLTTLANLAAMAIDRCRRQEERDGLAVAPEVRPPVPAVPRELPFFVEDEAIAQDISARIDTVFDQIQALIEGRADDPDLPTLLRPLEEQLEALEQEEARLIEGNYQAHFEFNPEEGQRLTDEIEKLLGRR